MKNRTNFKELIVKTDIKAGAISPNHNEKLANNDNIVEQKKRFGKKLRLSKETIRELKSTDLKRIAGGMPWYTAASKAAACCG